MNDDRKRCYRVVTPDTMKVYVATSLEHLAKVLRRAKVHNRVIEVYIMAEREIPIGYNLVRRIIRRDR